MTAPARLRSPEDLLPFSNLGYPDPGRYLLTLEQVKAAFVEAEILSGSETRPECWMGLMTYLQLWRSFSVRFDDIAPGPDRLIKSLWLGGSFIGTAKLNPNNIDLVVFVDGEAFHQADLHGVRYKAQLEKLTSRRRLEDQLRVTPTVVAYTYPGSPWQNTRYTTHQQDYMIKRGALDDWWSRVRPSGVPKGPPSPDTGDWVRGYVEVRL